MSENTPVQVSLSPDLIAFVQDTVASGAYRSASEMVSRALHGLREQQDDGGWSVEELRRLWDEGIASGPPEPLDIEDIKRKGRAMLEREKSSA